MFFVTVVVTMLTVSSCGTKKQIPSPTKRETPPPKEIVAPVPEEKATIPTQREHDYVDVNFDFDRYNLTPAAREILGRHANALLEKPAAALRIEGHCDERGTVDYNLALGERRASAVKAFLVQYGIPAESITTVSYGKERPKDLRRNEAGWAINRRAEFHLGR
jgi:peptidoglycan-associated lipoprotein